MGSSVSRGRLDRDACPKLLPRRTAGLYLFLLFTVLGLLSFSYKHLDNLARVRPGWGLVVFLEEMTGAYSALLLMPLILWFARRFDFRRSDWLRVALAHVAAAAVFSAAHTSLMAVSRKLLFPAFGLGPYDYGIMGFRYPMEFSKDLIIFAVIVGFIHFLDRVRAAQAQQLAVTEFEARLAEARLENLRLQLQPHFLFNTLNTISSVMYEDVRAADDMVTKLSELLRLTLRASASHEIPLAEELRLTQLYLDLMCRRYEDKLRVTYEVDSALRELLVPQLVLQPLVENSLRHGVNGGNAGISISIGARRENGSLILQIADTGVGLGAQTGMEIFAKGFGLANVRDRLAQLYGSRQDFSVENAASGGVLVTLRIPCHAPAANVEAGA